MSEREGRAEMKKERRYARKERRNDIEREQKREAARVESGRTREKACIGVHGGGSETTAYVF